MKDIANSTLLESNIRKTLTDVGLFTNDIEVYLFLISHPRSKTGPIIQTTKIGSSAIYQSLRNLLSRGLVSYEVKNNIKYYTAEEPLQLIDQLRESEKKLQEITSLIEDAKAMSGPRNFVNVFEGSYGFKKAFQQFVDSAEKGEDITIIGYNTKYFINDLPLRRFFTELDRGLAAKGAHAKVLVEKNLFPSFRKDRRAIDIYEMRSMPSKYFGPFAIDTTTKEVLITIVADTPIAISIKHPIIVDVFRKNFEYLWKDAKEV